MQATRRIGLIAIGMIALSQPAAADVIADWNEKAVTFVLAHHMGPPPAERIMAMTHVAMFDAVNSIERRYRPYLVQLSSAPHASKEAAAATAAGMVLAGVVPQSMIETRTALAAYLANIPDGPAKVEGVRIGEDVAAAILKARADDGARAPDSYRTRTASTFRRRPPGHRSGRA
jgi:hypothetical protein